jgi:hypothetical protein
MIIMAMTCPPFSCFAKVKSPASAARLELTIPAELWFSFLGLVSDTRLGGAQVEPFLTAVAPEAAPSLSFVQTRYNAARVGAAVVMAGEF